MPATKYWLKVTPSAIVVLKTEPKIANKIIGNASVKTTDSRWRINWRISNPPRATPSAIVVGREFFALITSLQSWRGKYLQGKDVAPVTLELRPEILQLVCEQLQWGYR